MSYSEHNKIIVLIVGKMGLWDKSKRLSGLSTQGLETLQVRGAGLIVKAAVWMGVGMGRGGHGWEWVWVGVGMGSSGYGWGWACVGVGMVGGGHG